jgi:hypothetical protein
MASLSLAGGLNISYATGSLFAQIQSSRALNGTNAFPLHTSDSLVNLTVLSDSTLQLNFLQGKDGATLLALPLIASLLNPNASRVLIECVYPLSGQYDTLPRVLFYLSRRFGFIFRHRNWVCNDLAYQKLKIRPIQLILRSVQVGDAILGTAMLYSAIAAIHFFVLQGTFQWGIAGGESSGPGAGLIGPWDSTSAKGGGDIDFWGVFPVLTVTGVMLAPILAWSSTFRKHEARPVIVIWAALVFAALIPALIRFWEYLHDGWSEAVLPSFAYCTETTKPGCSSSDLDALDYFTLEIYNKCNCVDFCGLLQPTAPMRTNVNMVAKLARQIAAGIICKRDLNGYCQDNTALTRLSLIVLVVWGFALIQGILAILQGRSTQSRVRNRIFKVLNVDFRTVRSIFYKGVAKDRLLAKHNKSREDKFYERCRRGLAKSIATAYYTTTAIGMIIYPATLIATIVLNEILLGIVPASEHSSSLGAWSPWAAAALIILASIGITWLPRIGANVKRMLRHFQFSDDRGKQEQEGNVRNHSLTATISDVPRHWSYRIEIAIWGLKTEWNELCEWWKDPVRVGEIER